MDEHDKRENPYLTDASKEMRATFVDAAISRGYALLRSAVVIVAWTMLVAVVCSLIYWVIVVSLHRDIKSVDRSTTLEQVA